MENPNKVKEIKNYTGGPRTDEGKQRSSQNAIKNGLFTRDLVLLAGETQEQFDKLHEGYKDDHKPRTTTEESMVYRLTLLDWRLARIPNLEGKVIVKAEETGDVECKGLDKFALYSQRLTKEFQTTLKGLHDEQAKRLEAFSQEWRQSVLLRDYFNRQGIDWDPASDEFVFSKERLDQQLAFNQQWDKVIENVIIYSTMKYQDERYSKKAL